MRFNIAAFFLVSLSGTMANAGFLQPTNFPKTVDDLSFVDRMMLKTSGYEQFESEYDSNGNCISGCSYAMPKWEDELDAMKRWNKLSHQELVTQHGYTENSDGSLTPPPIIPSQSYKTTMTPFPEETCANRNTKFGNRDIPYGNPLGYAACITSSYGPRELFGRKFHYGIDFNAVTGTPVYAPANGVVKMVFVRNETCGNGLVIEHSNGYSTKYCHFESVAVAKNDKVSAGCLIGTSDNTGQSTGPHLHYSVLKDGNAINPTDFIEPEHKMCR